jgi:hypothetical protein
LSSAKFSRQYRLAVLAGGSLSDTILGLEVAVLVVAFVVPTAFTWTRPPDVVEKMFGEGRLRLILREG